MGICPHHCPPEGAGGKTVLGVLAGLAAVALVAAPVTAAVSEVAHVVAVVVEVTAIVVASLLGLAVLAGVGLGVRSVVRWRARRAALVSRAVPAVAAPSWPDRPALGAAPPLALPAGRPVVPGVVVSEGERIRR